MSWFHHSAAPVPETSRRASRPAILSAASRPALTQLATHDVDLPQPAERVALAQLADDLVEATVVGHVECLALALREGGELDRRDELVLGPADHVGEAARGVRIACHRVIEEVHERGAQLAQQQSLADLVEDVRVLGQPKVCPMVRQHAVAE